MSIAAAIVGGFAVLVIGGVASCGAFSSDATGTDAADASASEGSLDAPSSSEAAIETDGGGDGAGILEAGIDTGAARHLRVFVLRDLWSISTMYPAGAMTGLSGRDSADHYCADEGVAGGLGASFVAFMSRPGSDAIARLPSDADWSLPNPTNDNALIFPSRAAIDLGNNPARALNRGADGRLLTDPETRVWTGTDVNGRATGSDCDDWGVFTLGTAGRTDSVGSAWTNAGAVDCGLPLHVFCFGY